MARMIPSSLENVSFTTAGERKVFDLLKKQLGNDCIVRYEMLIGLEDYRPDFTIIDPERGVIVVEVKDWGIKNITRATQEQFYVRGLQGSSTPKPQMNPWMKCEKIYRRGAIEQLLAMPGLRDEKSHLIMPIYSFVAFPNISREQFMDQRFEEIIPPEQVLFRENLLNDGNSFRQRYVQALPTLPERLLEEHLDEITTALFPEIAIPQVTQAGFITASGKAIVQSRLDDFYTLSLDQEEIAKSLGEGPRLLRGIAGTGKTLIMLYRAKLLAANNPNLQILILCWNTALGNYMHQVFTKFDIETQGTVMIKHFTDFARNLLNLRYVTDETWWDDDSFFQALRQHTVSEMQKYDAVFIDEAQDFRKEWIEYIFNHLIKGNPRQRNLIIAADDAQRIYRKRDFTWSSLGIPMTGRSKILRTIYRNSARIWVFSSFLLEEKASYVREAGEAERLKFSTKGGYDPQLIDCRDLRAQIDKTIEIVRSMQASNLAYRNVLILYRHKRWQGYSLVEELITRLHQERIPNDWISEDANAKRSFAWDAETLKISTVHSAKGMDSPVVIILGAETFRPEQGASDYDEIKMMYVALTRAREFLVILHSGEEGMVNYLKNCQKEYEKYRDQVIQIED